MSDRSRWNELQGQAAGLTFGAETSSDVKFGRGNVGKAQSALIKVLVGEEVSKAHVGGFPSDVHTELLQGDGRAEM